MRPKQWIKNLLILTVPFASKISDIAIWRDILIGFLVFSLLASSVYIFNDIYDYNSDKHHPVKKFRGIASGRISRRQSWFLFSLTLCLSIIGTIVFVPGIVYLIFTYLGVNLLYTLGLKTLPFVEIVAVASGFVIRVLVGARISATEPSSWILICSLSGAMFVVIGKRFAEKKNSSASNSTNHRKVLSSYTEDGLKTNLTVAASVFAGGYVQWASQFNPTHENRVWSFISSLGVLVFLMSYIETIYRGRGEQPEEDLMHGFQQIMIIVLTFLSMVLAVYSK